MPLFQGFFPLLALLILRNHSSVNGFRFLPVLPADIAGAAIPLLRELHFYLFDLG